MILLAVCLLVVVWMLISLVLFLKVKRLQSELIDLEEDYDALRELHFGTTGGTKDV